MRAFPMIKALTDAKGISGFEKEVVKTALTFIDSSLETEVAGLNNLYIKRQIDEYDIDKPILLLDGHSDELGFMVQSITAKGLLKIVPMGSWDVKNIPAHSVWVENSLGEWLKGVFVSKPPHFMSAEEKNRGALMEDMLIDVGSTSREETIKQLNVRIGAPVVPDVQTEIMHGTRLMGKAFDNRMGCALVIDLMNHFKHQPLAVRLVGALSSQEEIGSRGAQVTSYDIKPSAVIVFEGTPADDTFTPEDEIQGGIGRGCQIRHRDSSMVADPAFNRFAITLATQEAVHFQEAVRAGGGTDGGVYHMENHGAPSIVLGVPVRYAHTHYGISDYKDYEAAFSWAVALIESMSRDVIEGFKRID